MKRPFVLSGGGNRGFAHLGVLKAFAEKNIYPEVISATSAGAIIGAMICDGYTPDEVMELAVNNKLYSLFNWSFPVKGLMSLKPLQEFLQKYLRHKTFEELPIPLFIAVTDMNTGTQVVLNEGEIIPAVVAACSIPLVFPTVLIEGIHCADGGLSSNLPVEPLLHDYEDIIGIYVNPLPAYNEKANFSEMIDRLVHLMIRSNVIRNISSCTMYIEPPALAHFGIFDEKRKRMVFEEGYNFAKEKIAAAGDI
ncbi:patatin-like phospholipase family protein [Chitinophagaceae bacterium MMS25-I14]